MPDQYTHIGQQRWLRCTNGGDNDIPPFAPVSFVEEQQGNIRPDFVLDPDGVTLSADFPEIESEHRYIVSLPDFFGDLQINCRHIGFNSHLEIKAGGDGMCTLDTPAVSRVDDVGPSDRFLVPSFVGFSSDPEGDKLLRSAFPKRPPPEVTVISSYPIDDVAHIRGEMVFYDLGNNGLIRTSNTIWDGTFWETLPPFHTVVRRFHYRVGTMSNDGAA